MVTKAGRQLGTVQVGGHTSIDRLYEPLAARAEQIVLKHSADGQLSLIGIATMQAELDKELRRLEPILAKEIAAQSQAAYEKAHPQGKLAKVELKEIREQAIASLNLNRQNVLQQTYKRSVETFVKEEPATKLATEVKQYFSPWYANRRDAEGTLKRDQRTGLVDVWPAQAGMASQQARMLMLTETTRMHGMAQEDKAFEQGHFLRWKVSSSHQYTDICDQHAERDIGYGPGVYPPGHTPVMPSHPRCRCYFEIVSAEEALLNRSEADPTTKLTQEQFMAEVAKITKLQEEAAKLAMMEGGSGLSKEILSVDEFRSRLDKDRELAILKTNPELFLEDQFLHDGRPARKLPETIDTEQAVQYLKYLGSTGLVNFSDAEESVKAYVDTIKDSNKEQASKQLLTTLYANILTGVRKVSIDGLKPPEMMIIANTPSDSTYATYQTMGDLVTIHIPKDVNQVTKAWLDPTVTQKNADDGWHTNGYVEGVVIHELGHMGNYRRWADEVGTGSYPPRKWGGTAELNGKVYQPIELEEIAKSVSTYGTTNPVEFVAEVYAGVHGDKPFNKLVFDFYDKLKGPMTPKVISAYDAAKQRIADGVDKITDIISEENPFKKAFNAAFGKKFIPAKDYFDEAKNTVNAKQYFDILRKTMTDDQWTKLNDKFIDLNAIATHPEVVPLFVNHAVIEDHKWISSAYEIDKAEVEKFLDPAFVGKDKDWPVVIKLKDTYHVVSNQAWFAAARIAEHKEFSFKVFDLDDPVTLEPDKPVSLKSIAFPDSVLDRLKSDAEAWAESATQEENDVILFYRDNIEGFPFKANEGLRRDSLDTPTKERIAVLDKILDDNTLSDDLTLYRGISARPYESGGLYDTLKNLKPGDVFTEKGYMSTTADRAIASTHFATRLTDDVNEAIIFEINVPKDTGGLYLNAATGSEGLDWQEEVLLERGLTLKVTERLIEKLPGKLPKTVIRFDVVPVETPTITKLQSKALEQELAIPLKAADKKAADKKAADKKAADPNNPYLLNDKQQATLKSLEDDWGITLPLARVLKLGKDDEQKQEMLKVTLDGLQRVIDDDIRMPKELVISDLEPGVLGEYFPDDDRLELSREPDNLTGKATGEGFFHGWGASQEPYATIIHEFGHLAHSDTLEAQGRDLVKMVNGEDFIAAAHMGELTDDEVKKVAKKVSQYGVTNAGEFVAEVYAGTMAGKDHDPFIWRLYDIVGGPITPTIKKEMDKDNFKPIDPLELRKQALQIAFDRGDINDAEFKGLQDPSVPLPNLDMPVFRELYLQSVEEEKIYNKAKEIDISYDNSQYQTAWKTYANPQRTQVDPKDFFEDIDVGFEKLNQQLINDAGPVDPSMGSKLIELGSFVTQKYVDVPLDPKLTTIVTDRPELYKSDFEEILKYKDVEAFIHDKGAEPYAFKYKGVYYVSKEHTIVAAARLEGREKLPFLVSDLDEVVAIQEETKKILSDEATRVTKVVEEMSKKLDPDALIAFEKLQKIGYEIKNLEVIAKIPNDPDGKKAEVFTNTFYKAIGKVIDEGVALPKSIRINDGATYFTTLAYYEPDDDEIVQITADSSYDPEVQKKSFAEGWHSSPNNTSTLVHEFGHKAHFDNLLANGFHYNRLNNDSNDEYRKYVSRKFAGKTIGKQVSEYGQTNIIEFVAEVFTGAVDNDTNYDPKVWGFYEAVGGAVTPTIQKKMNEAGYVRKPFATWLAERKVETDSVLTKKGWGKDITWSNERLKKQRDAAKLEAALRVSIDLGEI